MALLLDIFGFLAVLLRGATLVAQALTLGGIAFLLLLARPLAPDLGPAGLVIERRCRRLAAGSAVALALTAAITVTVQAIVLSGTAEIPIAGVLGAGFVLSGAVTAAAGLVIAVLCAGRFAHPARLLLPLLALVVMIAATATSHAASRLDHRLLLTLATALHQAAAAMWIGGIPYFLIALAGCCNGLAWRRVGRRFSVMSMVAVAGLLAGGIAMTLAYVDGIEAVYGTAYGVMLSTKVLMFAGLLFLGFMNFRVVERLRREPATPVIRLRRFAEAELGIGITVFLAAASLTSLPPAVDLTQDRVTVAEIVERLTPHWPALRSPDHASLAIPEIQARLDAAAAAGATRAQAYVPGGGIVPPIKAEDIAWSEYNHNWAGLFVLAIGLLALAEQTGRAPWARHWPLLFLVLGGFVAIRSDPETWPLGDIGFFESLRDPEVAQHRIFVLLIAAFALFEWGIRTGRLRSPRAALVFPLMTAVGGALLLTHSHALANVKQELLIEYTHVPLAVLGIAAGWTRWLELRLPPPGNRIAGWIWPICFVLVGLLLFSYREA